MTYIALLNKLEFITYSLPWGFVFKDFFFCLKVRAIEKRDYREILNVVFEWHSQELSKKKKSFSSGHLQQVGR